MTPVDLVRIRLLEEGAQGSPVEYYAGDLAPAALIDASTNPPTWLRVGDGDIDEDDLRLAIDAALGLKQFIPELP